MGIESLDTNILLRIILEDNKRLYKVAERLLAREGVEYDVADIAISEMVYVLEVSLGFSREFVKRAIRRVLRLPNIRYNRALFDEVLPFYEAHPALSFNDCCLAGYAAARRAEPLWTFDRKLATQSGTAKLAG